MRKLPWKNYKHIIVKDDMFNIFRAYRKKKRLSSDHEAIEEYMIMVGEIPAKSKKSVKKIIGFQ